MIVSVTRGVSDPSIDLELEVGRNVVAAIAAVGDDAREVRADLRLDLRDHGREGVAVVGVARHRLGVGDELAAFGAMERGGERDLDAELVGRWALPLPMHSTSGACRE